MRNNQYLANRLEILWKKYFNDIPLNNKIIIQFGKKAQFRLGSIRRRRYAGRSYFDTLIYLNGHFRDKTIPAYVIDATICHELAHYAHGFSSPLPQLSRFPHRGGIIDKELNKRMLTNLVEKETNWLRNHWLDHIKSKHDA